MQRKDCRGQGGIWAETELVRGHDVGWDQGGDCGRARRNQILDTFERQEPAQLADESDVGWNQRKQPRIILTFLAEQLNKNGAIV